MGDIYSPDPKLIKIYAKIIFDIDFGFYFLFILPYALYFLVGLFFAGHRKYSVIHVVREDGAAS